MPSACRCNRAHVPAREHATTGGRRGGDLPATGGERLGDAHIGGTQTLRLHRPCRAMDVLGANKEVSRPGRYRTVAENLDVREVVVGEDERRRRYAICFNPKEARREKAHRDVKPPMPIPNLEGAPSSPRHNCFCSFAALASCGLQRGERLGGVKVGACRWRHGGSPSSGLRPRTAGDYSSCVANAIASGNTSGFAFCPRPSRCRPTRRTARGAFAPRFELAAGAFPVRAQVGREVPILRLSVDYIRKRHPQTQG